MKKLSIGLLVDKPNANIYVEDLITWSKEQENISIDYLILQKKK